VYKAPIKASYCDNWFKACKDDFLCVDGSPNGDISWFAHPKLNAAKNCTKASGNCKTIGAIYSAALPCSHAADVASASGLAACCAILCTAWARAARLTCWHGLTCSSTC
jgi:hypothetical protein